MSKKDKTSILLIQNKDKTCNIYAERIHNASNREEDSCERMDSQEYENRPSHGHFVCRHEDRFCFVVQVPSLFQDSAVSWVGIVNGVDLCVTEPDADHERRGRSFGRNPLLKQDQERSPQFTLTSVSVPVLGRIWIDIETQRSHDHKRCRVSKATTRLLRHDQTVPRGIDGTIQLNDIIEECRKQKFDDASQWLLEDWISTLAKGGGVKKRFQYCLNPNSSSQFLYLRAIQGHSGDYAVDPALQDNVLLPKSFTEYIYRVGNANELNSIIISGLIPGGKKPQERKTSYVLRHGHMQSFSTAHCLQLALRKRYAWKLRMISARRFA